MSLNRFGSRREPAWWPSVLKGKAESALRIRNIERSTGLMPFVPVDWTEHALIQDQLGNSCLGQSQAQCIWIWLRLHGIIPESFPNPYRAYWYARRRRDAVVTDSGAYTSDIWWALAKYRAVAMDSLLDALRDLNNPPRDVDDLRAVDVIVEAKPIYDQGEKLVLRVCDSLAKRQPVQLSLPVERSLLNNQGPEVIEAPEQTLDLGHAVTAIGCRESSRGRWPEILIANSWGLDWRRRGCAWISGEYAAQAYSVRYVDNVQGWV